MKRPWWLLFLLLAAPLLAAERPAITVLSDGQAIAIKPATTLPYTWVCIDKGDGKFAGVLAVVDGGKPVTWIYQIAIDAKPDPGPDPGPDPKPDPKPDPVPVKVAFIHVVRETGENTPAIGAVIDSKPWRDVADSLKITYRVWDVTSAEKAFPNIVAKAKAVGLPAVVSLDSAGAAVAEKLPATADAMADLVKKKGGVR